MKKPVYFTPGELRVLKLIGKGYQRKKIDDKLKRSIHTVDGYIRRLHKLTKTPAGASLKGKACALRLVPDNH
jgi:DNA-binding CsgD family transcriptional regulator